MSAYSNRNKQADTAGKEKKEELFMGKKEIKDGLLIFFGGSALCIFIFSVVCWVLSAYDVNYMAASLLALVITALLVISLDKAMGEKKTRMKTPVATMLIICFLLSLLIGHSRSSAAENTTKKTPPTSEKYSVSGSETLTLTNTGKLFTHECFSRGQKIYVRVYGAPVKMYTNNGLMELNSEHGAYPFTIADYGSVNFYGIDRGHETQSNIVVTW